MADGRSARPRCVRARQSGAEAGCPGEHDEDAAEREHEPRDRVVGAGSAGDPAAGERQRVTVRCGSCPVWLIRRARTPGSRGRSQSAPTVRWGRAGCRRGAARRRAASSARSDASASRGRASRHSGKRLLPARWHQRCRARARETLRLGAHRRSPAAPPPTGHRPCAAALAIVAVEAPPAGLAAPQVLNLTPASRVRSYPSRWTARSSPA